MRIGIPKALLYYKQSPLWFEFFSHLNQEVIVSIDTDITLIKDGSLLAPSEACMPVKIFFGHVSHLKNKVDYVFIPRVVSVEGKAYTCPKFLGLPDMIKACDDMPPVLTATFDYRNNRKDFYRSVLLLGSHFSKNPLKILRAYRKGVHSLKKHEENLIKVVSNKKSKRNGLKIALVGHPYNLFDKYASLNLVERLRLRGVQIVTQENIEKDKLMMPLTTLSKQLFWTYEKEVVGGAFHFLNNHEVDGIIYMLSFACGPDSLMQCVIENKAKEKPDIPLLSLVVDEHSAEAGLMTRVEAFLDMLERKKK